jgi:hypothetical protein
MYDENINNVIKLRNIYSFMIVTLAWLLNLFRGYFSNYQQNHGRIQPEIDQKMS